MITHKVLSSYYFKQRCLRDDDTVMMFCVKQVFDVTDHLLNMMNCNLVYVQKVNEYQYC